MIQRTINERKIIEDIIRKEDANGFEPSDIIRRLVHYSMTCLRMNREETRKNVHAFMKRLNKRYLIKSYDEYIRKLCKIRYKPVRSFNTIPITQEEIDIVNAEPNKNVQKVLFAYIVIAKMNYKHLESAWVNETDTDMFNLANVKRDKAKREDILYYLISSGKLAVSKKVDNVNIQVMCLNTDMLAEPVLEITDLAELGLQWERFKGETDIKECQVCKRLFKANSNSQKYCKEHQGYQPVEEDKIKICFDCNNEFTVSTKGHNKVRCNNCQKEHRKHRNIKK